MIPSKLSPGDTIRIIAPSRSFKLISKDNRLEAIRRLEAMGLKVTFGRHIEESDEFMSSSVESRLEDLHEAFADPKVKGILTVIGGFNSNQLLSRIDYGLIARNPKILCGYSDISALQNAVFAKTGLVTYSGPHFSTFAMKRGSEYTIEYFNRCLFSSEPYRIEPSAEWSDDRQWYADQDNRTFRPTTRYRVLREGSAEGTIVGANQCTFQLLVGTPFLPDLRDKILFLEECDIFGEATSVNFDRLLQSILHQPSAQGLRALVVGRFQSYTGMTDEVVWKILSSKPELAGKPIVTGVDFGHTYPLATFPIGGRARIEASKNTCEISILDH